MKSVVCFMISISSVIAQSTTPASPQYDSSHQILSGGLFKEDPTNSSVHLRNIVSPGSYGLPWTNNYFYQPHRTNEPIYDNGDNYNRDNHLYGYPPSNGMVRQDNYGLPYDRRNGYRNNRNDLNYENPYYPSNGPYEVRTKNGYSPRNNGHPYRPTGHHQYYNSYQNPQIRGMPHSDGPEYNNLIGDPNYHKDPNSIDDEYRSNPHYSPIDDQLNYRSQPRTFTPQGVFWDNPRHLYLPYRRPNNYWNARTGPYPQYPSGTGRYPPNMVPYTQSIPQDPRDQRGYPFTNTAPIQFTNN